MSTYDNIQPSLTRSAALASTFDWRARLERLVDRWRTHRQASAERWLDGYFRRQRNAHERFLAKATDHYELERLERAWERRHTDMWRVF